MNYSKTDLSAILARPKDFPKQEEESEEKDEVDSSDTYIHRKDSMYDYFKQKQCKSSN